MTTLSAGERAYIITGAARGVRSDGRSPLGRRSLTLETAVLPTASASARVRVAAATDVLVGVTTDLSSPSPSAPHDGLLQFAVTSTSTSGAGRSRAAADDANAQLSVFLSSLYSGDATRALRQALCLIPRRKCWLLKIDVLVLASGGGVYDAAALAVRAALLTALVPRVRVVPGEADDEDEVEVDEGELSGLEGARGSPVAVTLNLLGEGDGSGVYVADADAEEEACAAAAVSVGVGGGGSICGTVMGGVGGLGVDALESIIHDAHKLGTGVVAACDEFVDDLLKKRDAGEVPDVIGFFG